MYDSMAIRTHWPKILNWVDLVVRSNTRQSVEVMNVNEAGHYIPVNGHEIEAADETSRPVMLDTFFSCAGIALVTVDQDTLRAAFGENGILGNFLREPDVIYTSLYAAISTQLIAQTVLARHDSDAFLLGPRR
ncbi:MAG: hypothetical protein WD875_15990 [Pirellulales bacterium]